LVGVANGEVCDKLGVERVNQISAASHATSILLSGLIGAIVGATAAILSQLLADRLARERELGRFRVQSFERFRREFSEDATLKAIYNKYPDQRLTNKEIEDYLGFFEEIGIYAQRSLVDVDLVDLILGDYIIECYEEHDIMDRVRSLRIAEGDNSYFEFFEKLAARLVTIRNERRLRNKP
jgi:hypothetical protein